jgi:hypothetical protein
MEATRFGGVNPLAVPNPAAEIVDRNVVDHARTIAGFCREGEWGVGVRGEWGAGSGESGVGRWEMGVGRREMGVRDPGG